MDKIRVYVHSIEVSTLGFVDKEGAVHGCAQAGNLPFEGLKHHPGSMDNRYLSEEEKKTILMVEDFCKKNGCEFEVVDVAKKGFLTKMKLKAKGLANFPSIAFKEKIIHGVPTEETLRELVE